MNYPTTKSPGFIRRLLSRLGASITFLRNTVFNTLFVVVLVIFLFAALGGSHKPLPAQFALRIAPQGMLVDQRNYLDTASMLMKNDKEENETLVRDLVDAINHAADDNRISHIVLDLGGLQGGGITKMEEIGQALLAFKAKQKNIIAIADNYSQDQYYLASFANEIILHPMGEVQLTGFSRYITYYKSALEKLGVNVHVFRSGKYKDYVEPYLRDSMSDESREHNAQWLNALWAQYTQRVEEQRKLPAGALNKLINNLDTQLLSREGDYGQLALDEKLVDKLLSRAQLDELLITKFGKSNDGEFYNAVDTHAYLADINSKSSNSNNKIGLIVASGTIQDGHQEEGSIGSESFIELLRGVKTNSEVKALVIRIDSGGGSAFASELIRAEIDAIHKKNIPIFISMGSVAASGGYWMATAGDEIWAMPTTITGSIGVFGAFPTLENSLQKLGVTTDGISTTELGGNPSIDRALTPKMGNVIQTSVDHTYQSFLKLVAGARKKDTAEIHEIAQGHVWTGKKALEIGLVDHLGSLNDVIAAAAQRMKLDNYQVELISQKLSPKEEFIRKLVEDDALSIFTRPFSSTFSDIRSIHQQLSPLVRPLANLKAMNDPQGIYASCLECLVP